MKLKYEVDPKLELSTAAFGAIIVGSTVLIPEQLGSVVGRVGLGGNAITLAKYMVAFPTSLMGNLNWSLEDVKIGAQSFIELLDDSGADISGVRKGPQIKQLG